MRATLVRLRDQPRPAWQRGALWLACLALFPSLLATGMRLAPPRDDATALLASFIPYAVLGYGVALLGFLIGLLRRSRRRELAALAVLSAALLTLHLAWLAPRFVPDSRVPASAEFTLLSLNLHQGRADLDQLSDLSRSADVVVLAETTPATLQALRSRGWRERYPYLLGEEGSPPVADTTVYSRYPLSEVQVQGDPLFRQRVATLAVPRVGDVRLMPQHPCNPYCGGGLWTQQHAVVAAVAAANLDRPLLLAGDFNAVDEHGPMLDLHRLGLRSATDLVGAGWLPTYPANSLLPPLLEIDHVLVNDQLTATGVSTVRVSGTDHLGLLTTLARSAATS